MIIGCDRCDEQEEQGRLSIFDAIDAERVRQETLKAQGKFKYSCADLLMEPLEIVAVLIEELGEVAKDVMNVIGHSTDYPPEEAKRRLRKELIELAACAVAAVERLDKEPK